jgi:hypothetical protein
MEVERLLRYVTLAYHPRHRLIKSWSPANNTAIFSWFRRTRAGLFTRQLWLRREAADVARYAYRQRQSQ